jgi:hypothetical protein
MQSGIPTTERAFQIAGSGWASNVHEIQRALRREGYAEALLHGRALFRQLPAVIKGRTPTRETAGVT